MSDYPQIPDDPFGGTPPSGGQPNQGQGQPPHGAPPPPPPPQGNPYGQAPGTPPYGDPANPYGQTAPYQYGGVGYGPPPAKTTNTLAIVSLVLGICSWVICCIGPLLGIPAIITGYLGMQKADNELMGEGKGLAIAGLVIGALSTVLLGAWIVWSIVAGSFSYSSY